MADNSTRIVITAEDKTGAALKTAQANLASLASKASMVSTAFSAVGSISLVGMAKSAIDAGDQLNKMSQKTGIAVESLSALKYAGELSDVSLESLGGSLKKLAVNMNEVAATGKGDAAAAFKAIGVEVKNAAGQMRSTDDVMADIADRFAAMEDGAGKTALAVALFGKSGADMIPLLNQGSKGMKAMADEAKALGVIVGKDFAKASEEFNDNLTRISATGKAFGMAIANEVLPWLKRMTDELIEARKQGIGLWEGIRNLGTVNPGNTPRQNIRDIDEKIAKLEAAAKGKDSPDVQASRAARLAELQRARAYFSARERDTAPSASYSNEERRGGIGLEAKKAAPVFSSGGAAKKIADEFTPLMKAISEKTALANAELTATEKLTSAEQYAIKVRADIAAGYVKLNAGQRAKVEAALDELLATDAVTKSMDQQAKAAEQLAEQELKQINLQQKKDALVKDVADNGRRMIERTQQQQALIGMREREKQVIEAVRKLEDEAAEARDRAFRDIEDPKTYAAAIAEINANLASQKVELANATGAVYDYATSWETGAKDALARYLDEVGNMAAQSSNLVTKAFKGMEDALVEFVKTGKLDFKSLADSIITDLIRIQVRQNITKPLAEAMSSGGGLSGITDWIGGLFGGGRAAGGPVDAGKFYVVGENWPELLMAGASGTVIPNGARAPSPVQVSVPPVNINFSVSAMDSGSFRSSMAANRNVIVGIVREAFTRRAITSPV